ncbi:MAG: CDGSH iron-sulfur domain-containing protein [Oligoflexia bacterium]|nr:CDGSH iron-sulfur domain-containing protein [Oligoflexia bacterium]
MSVKITVNNNGSLKIESATPEEVLLCDSTGKQFDLAGRTKISLCRCGQSANKPFCDGAHSRCGFESTVVATILPPPKAG